MDIYTYRDTDKCSESITGTELEEKKLSVGVPCVPACLIVNSLI